MGRELSLWACIDYAVSGGHTFNSSSFIRSSIITTGAIGGKKEVCWRANKFTAGRNFSQIWLWWLNPPFWPGKEKIAAWQLLSIHRFLKLDYNIAHGLHLHSHSFTLTDMLVHLFWGIKKDRKSTNHLTPLKHKLIHHHVTQLAWKKRKEVLHSATNNKVLRMRQSLTVGF